jgi:hypothetical protein
MKKIFTLALIVFLNSAAHSQLSIGMHLGASNKNTIFGMHSQYQFSSRFVFGINMTTHTDNSNPAYFQSRFGYTFGNMEKGLSIQPYTGYCYMIQNIGKNIFGGHYTTGVQLRYQLTHVALVYADINFPAPKTFIFSVGIAGRLFHRND